VSLVQHGRASHLRLGDCIRFVTYAWKDLGVGQTREGLFRFSNWAQLHSRRLVHIFFPGRCAAGPHKCKVKYWHVDRVFSGWVYDP